MNTRLIFLLFLFILGCAHRPASFHCTLHSFRQPFRELDKYKDLQFSLFTNRPMVSMKDENNKEVVWIGLKEKSLLCSPFDSIEKYEAQAYFPKEEYPFEIFTIESGNKVVGFWEIYPENEGTSIQSLFYAYSENPKGKHGRDLSETIYRETIDSNGVLLYGKEEHQDDSLKYTLNVKKLKGNTYHISGKLKNKNVSFNRKISPPPTSHLGQELLVKRHLLEGKYRQWTVSRLKQKRVVKQKVLKIDPQHLAIFRPDGNMTVTLDKKGKVQEIVEPHKGFTLTYKRAVLRAK